MGQHVSALTLKRKIKKEKRKADKSFEKKKAKKKAIQLDASALALSSSSSTTTISSRSFRNKKIKDEESEEEPLSVQFEQGDSSTTCSTTSCSSTSSFNSWYCDSQELSFVNTSLASMHFELWHEFPTEMKYKVLSFLPLLDLCCFALASKECYQLVNGNHFWRGLCLRDLAPAEDIEKEEFFATLLRDKPLEIDERETESEQATIKQKTSSLKGKERQTDIEGEEEPTTSEEKEEKNVRQIKRLLGDIKWKDVYRYWLERVLIIYIVYETYQDIFDVREKLTDAGLLVTTMYYCTKTKQREPVVDDWLGKVAQMLKAFNTVLFFTNDESAAAMPEDMREKIGNILADFVEAGNSVIVSTFANGKEEETPGGRWAVQNYNPILPHGQDATLSSLKERNIPDHPILRNVTNISADFKGDGELNDEATVIATYEDNSILAAEMEVGTKGGLVISINIFPLSNDTDLTGGWDNEPGNDVVQLFANAVRYGTKHKKMRQWNVRNKMMLLERHIEEKNQALRLCCAK